MDGEYIRVVDGYLEVRMKCVDGHRSASGKTMLIASTGGGKRVEEGQFKGKDVTLSLNAYYKV